MMPVMPMDPASQAAVVARAMIEATASQSLEPGSLADPGAGLGSQASSAPEITAGDVMPVPPSTATSAGATVSMAPSVAQVAPSGPGPSEATSTDQASAAFLPAEPGQGSERVADTAVPIVLSSLHTTTTQAPQRQRVERDEQPRRRPRQPARQDTDEPPPEPSPPATEDEASPPRPLTLATLWPTLAQHAGGLALTEMKQGRRVIVLDIATSQQGHLRGALLWWPAGRDQPVLMACMASVDTGWGWAWAQMTGQHWRLRRDITADGSPALFSPDAMPGRPFCIGLRTPAPRLLGTHLQIRLADPIRFQRHLGRQWTYLALLISLDHEPAPIART